MCYNSDAQSRLHEMQEIIPGRQMKNELKDIDDKIFQETVCNTKNTLKLQKYLVLKNKLQEMPKKTE